MAYRISRLPERFPVGTKFVVEGKRGGKGRAQVFTRYLEFPDGTHISLPARPAPRTSAPKSAPTTRRRAHSASR
jgi:hypothetical protein